MNYINFLVIGIGWILSCSAYSLEFNFTTSGLNSNALAALNRAANSWSRHITDQITVNINVNMSSTFTDNSIIGSASSFVLASDYSGIRNAMVTDAASESDDAVVAFLPTASQLQFLVPQGFTLDGNVSGTKANFKALGFTGLDNQFGAMDGKINFNSQFAFDFDSADGVNSNTLDFETVAAHEIGHILGFNSIVDRVDSAISNGETLPLSPFLLDLFRFGNTDNPSTTADFSTAVRDIVPGGETYFDDLIEEVLFSTGDKNGDGRQASHWKDNGLTGDLLGIMDPTLATTEVSPVTFADLRALDVIGYDIEPVPLPGAVWLFGSGLMLLIRNKLWLAVHSSPDQVA